MPLELLNLPLDASVLRVLDDKVELWQSRIVDDLVELEDVGVVNLFHDGHFQLDVVIRASAPRDMGATPPQPLLVHHLHRIGLLRAHVDAEVDLGERARTELLHHLVLVDSLPPADPLRYARGCRDTLVPQATRIALDVTRLPQHIFALISLAALKIGWRRRRPKKPPTFSILTRL